MFRFFALAATLVATALFTAPARANLSIDRLWVDFDSSHSGRADVVIRNDGTERYYVTVAASEILAPGTDHEQRVTPSDPNQLGLLVTPNRIVLEPGALRSIRIVSLNENLTHDRIYRILISPQVGEIRAPQTPEEQEQQDRQVVIKLLAAYDVLVVARPPQAHPNLQATRTPTEVVLSNTGNTNVLLANAYVCPPSVTNAETHEGCQSLEAHRLYAGDNIHIPLSSPNDHLFVRSKISATSEAATQEF